MEGDEKAGVSIFWADDGLDTGPILLQKDTKVDINDTVDTIYNRFLYPEGIRAMVSEGKAQGPPYQGLWWLPNTLHFLIKSIFWG